MTTPLLCQSKKQQDCVQYIEQPIDPNSLKATRVEAYKQKQGAAWKLGDAVKQEEILRECGANGY